MDGSGEDGPIMLIAPSLLDGIVNVISPWVFNGAASTEEAESASSGATINMPPQSAGDLLVMYGSAQPGAPSGWTTASTGNIDCYYRISGGSEAPVTAVGTLADEGRFIHVLSFTHSLGLTPTFVTSNGQQRLGADDFIIPSLFASGSWTDVLNVSGAVRTGGDAVNVPPTFVDIRFRTSAGDTWYLTRTPDFAEWALVVPPTRFTTMGTAYSISASSATPATEWRYWYNPFDGATGGKATQGTTLMFRGV